MTSLLAPGSRGQTPPASPGRSPPEPASSPPADGICLRRLIEDIVASVFDVEAAELTAATRGRARIAMARQVAMYIAHVGYGLTLTEVGRLFERDRTTVAHACCVVEARRDDKGFDEAVVLLELVIRAINGPIGATGGKRNGPLGSFFGAPARSS